MYDLEYLCLFGVKTRYFLLCECKHVTCQSSATISYFNVDVIFVILFLFIFLFKSNSLLSYMSECALFNPDKVFRRFKLVDFPTSYVELSTKQILDVEINLNTSAYLKTLCEGDLLVSLLDYYSTNLRSIKVRCVII